MRKIILLALVTLLTLAVALPALSAEAVVVKYYLTERDMGPGEDDILQCIRAIIRDYHLAEGEHYLRSSLDTSYPDESATLTIEGDEATLKGPYFSRPYTIALR